MENFFATLWALFVYAVATAFYYAVVVLFGGLFITLALMTVDMVAGTDMAGAWRGLMGRMRPKRRRRTQPAAVSQQQAPEVTVAPRRRRSKQPEDMATAQVQVAPKGRGNEVREKLSARKAAKAETAQQ